MTERITERQQSKWNAETEIPESHVEKPIVTEYKSEKGKGKCLLGNGAKKVSQRQRHRKDIDRQQDLFGN
jgi:hypothetical protein